MFFKQTTKKLCTQPKRTPLGFTMVELLVILLVATVITSLTTMSFGSFRRANRDTQRLSDINQMQGALAMFYRDWETYPAEVTPGAPLVSGSVTYLDRWPSNPLPRTDGICPDSDYYYARTSVPGGVSYYINFCLSTPVGGLGTGINKASPPNRITNCGSNIEVCAAVASSSPTCQDSDCGPCQKCSEEGQCVNQDDGEDVKDDCSVVAACDTGACNGFGACGTYNDNQQHGCEAGQKCINGSCLECANNSDCGFCQKCSSNTCVAQTDGEDLKNDCTAFTCTSILKGFSSNLCQTYGSATALNGTCNGAGACNAYTASCTGATTHQTCGSAGCNNTCPAGSLASSYPNLGDVCYTDSLQHSCSDGYKCSASSATCVVCETDADCPFCQKCSGGSCVNQTSNEDTKDECDTTNCNTGNCNGSGACGVYDDGLQHNCAANYTCAAGVCSAWTTVGSNCGFLYFGRLAISSDGYPYLVHKGNTGSYPSKPLVKRYAGSWSTIGSFPDYTVYNAYGDGRGSLFVYSGVPHLVVNEDADVKVRKYNGSSWAYLGLVGGSSVTQYPMLFIYNGVSYVASLGSSPYKISVKQDGGVGSFGTLGSERFSAGSAFGFDLFVYNGTAYVSYIDGPSTDKVTVKYYNGSSWADVGSAAFSVASCSETSLFVDNGTPYVTYRNSSGTIYVKRYNGSSWVDLGSPAFSGSGTNPKIYVDNGIIYVAYVDSANSYRATVKKYTGSAWVGVGQAGFGPTANYIGFPSLVVYNGTPYVSYRDYNCSPDTKMTVKKYGP